MSTIYISETMQTCDFIKRFILYVKKIFNIVKISNVDGKVILYLPIFQEHKLSKYRIKKLSQKIIKVLKKEKIVNIVLSNYLETIELLKNNLYSNNLNILDGRYLFKTMKLRRSFTSN